MKRNALVIANNEFNAPKLAQLVTPARDAKLLAEVLGDRKLGGFDVTTCFNRSCAAVLEEIEGLFRRKQEDDVLLLYYAGYGIQDDFGDVFYATRNTKMHRFRSSSVSASFIRSEIEKCKSKRKIVILDCWYCGMFDDTVPHEKIGTQVDAQTAFDARGEGRAVLTASDTIYYVWENDTLLGDTGPSVFTQYIVEGLIDGSAARPGVSDITADDLHAYIQQRFTNAKESREIPRKWGDQVKGPVVISSAPDAVVDQAKLDEPPGRLPATATISTDPPAETPAPVSEENSPESEASVEADAPAETTTEPSQPEISLEDIPSFVIEPAAGTGESRPHRPATPIPADPIEPEQVGEEPIDAAEPEQVEEEPIEAVEVQQVEEEPIGAEPVVELADEEPAVDLQTPVKASSLEIEPVEVTVEPADEIADISEEIQPAKEQDEPSELPAAVIVPPQEAHPTSPIVQQLQDSLLTATYSNSIGIEFALITPGEFVMGDDEGDDDEKPAHKVAISTPFYIGTGQVTQAQWEAVMGNNPSRFKGVDNPVETVSFDDVAEFIKRLNDMEGKVQHRLPTEAEWEYACRAGADTAFSTGDAITTDQSNFNGNHPYGDLPKGEYRQQTTPVASFPPNAFGIYDMHGNVWEWTSDFFRSYADQTKPDEDDRQAGAPRVIRGGSWHNSARSCRSAKRFIITPVYRNAILGFRLVRTID